MRVPARPPRHLLLALGAVLTVAAAPAVTAAADPAPCSVSANLVNSCRPWLGAYVGNYPAAGTGAQNQILYHEQRIGRPLDIVHTYHGVGDNSLSASDLYFASRPGTMLFVNWKPTANWGDIASQNAGIDQMATSIKTLGTSRVFLALYHEPEKSVSPGGDPNCPSVQYKGTSGTVADYRNMWQYVENRFAADGVNNVVWVLDYMNYQPWDCLIRDLYPGDQYVDWITFNAYQSSGTASFADVVGRFTNLLTADTDAQHSFTSKPWGVAEWGTHGYTVAQEEAYYDSAKAALDGNQFPQLKMYLAFDDTDQNLASGANYRVGYDDNGTLDPVKAAHYTAFADDPLLAGSYQPPAPPPDITAPTASLTSPADQSTVNGAVTVAGTASDDRSVSSVRLLVDGADAGLQPDTTAGDDTFTWDSTTVANGQHTLQLQATDGAGNVGSSNTVTVTVANPDVTPPSVPVAQAEADGPHQIAVSWGTSLDDIGVAGYDVYRDGSLLATVDAGTSYVDTALDDATTYTYTVDAFDAAGNTSAASDPAAATTTDGTSPSTPTDVTASADSPHQVSLSWDASTDNVGVTAYQVYRDGTMLATVEGVTSYVDTALNDATTYNYTVDAVDAAGNASDPSDAASATTPDATPPSDPAQLTATITGQHQVELDWQPASDNVGVTGYQVYRDGMYLGSVTDGTNYVDTGVPDAQTYTYSVVALDQAGNPSAGNDTAVITLPDVTAPSVATGITATATGAHSVEIDWQPATDNVAVDHYDVYRDGTFVGDAAGGTSYTDTGLTDATQYTYAVVAVDAAGNRSDPSTSASATTPDATPPTSPATVRVKAVSATQTTLTWSKSTDNVGVTGYLIYRNGVLLASVAPTTAYQDMTVTGATVYKYTVAAVDAAGNVSALSATAQLRTPGPDTTAPTTPTNLTAALTATKAVLLRWGASTDNVGVAGYQIFRDGQPIASVAASLRSFTDSTAPQAQAHTYTVAAYDAAANVSAMSNQVTITVPDTIPPSTPTNLTLTPGSKSITLSWTASTDNVAVKGYLVFRNGVQIANITTGTTFTNLRLTTGTTYSYYVIAYDTSNRRSAPSTTQSATAG